MFIIHIELLLAGCGLFYYIKKTTPSSGAV